MQSNKSQKTHSNYIWTGFLVWVLLALVLRPMDPQNQSWVYLILSLAPLVVVPLGLTTASKKTSIFPALGLIAAILFSISVLLEQGILAGLLAGVWVAYTLILLLKEWQAQHLKFTWTIFSYGFLLVGAIWSMADRFAYRPLDFDPIIVLLTGVHFHYAGFVLPLLVQQLQLRKSLKIYDWFGRLVVAGVISVAIAITSTHLEGPTILEGLGGSVMVIAASGLAFAHFPLITSANNWGSKLCFGLGAFFLLGGMGLAFLYAWRFHLSISYLSIPVMYALHGTLNSLGTGVLLLLGWNLGK